MNNIAVSIIVPIYNKEKYLRECLDSILNQTLKNIEIILVNDGSTDDSEKICKTFFADTRVKYLYQDNEGLASARQTGINVAKGEYIGFIDADDWIELEMFDKMYNKAIKYDADVVFCNRLYNDDAYRPTKEIETGFYDRERIIKEVLPKSLAYISEKGGKRVISWSNCRRIYRRQLLDDIQFQFDKRFRRSQDLQLTYEVMLRAKTFYHMGDDYFYHARTVGNSLARGYTYNMWELYVPLIERLYMDTKNFREADLMQYMHLRNFFFVTECIENEIKPTCPNTKKQKIKLISEIINHPLCDVYYGKIDSDKLNSHYKQYYKLIAEKDAKKLLQYMNMYKNKNIFKKRYYAPIMDMLTESRIVGTIYKKIRKKI